MGLNSSEVIAGDGRGFRRTMYLVVGGGRGGVLPSPSTLALSLGELKGRTGLQSARSRVRNGMRSAMNNPAKGGCPLWGQSELLGWRR